MGERLERYGESICGTRGGPFKPGDYGVSTRKGTTIYVHVLEWADDTLKLPALPAKVARSRLLGDGKVEARQTAEGLEITLPEGGRQPLDTVVAIELDRPALDIPAMDVPVEPSLATGAKSTASNTFQMQPQCGPDKAVDGNNDTPWATDAGTKAAWLEVDLGRPATIGRAVIEQAYPELKRVRKFAIEYRQDDQRRTCLRGENLEATFHSSFDPITAQRVRLNIIEATDGPTIWEFQLFR
jgi:alpha-L-fucosidase